MRLANTLVGLTGPSTCLGCRARGSALCPGCAVRLSRPVARGTVPGVERVIAACEYVGVARELVLALKLGSARAAAEPLVDAMLRAAVREGFRGRTVTWVPARRADRRVRGYDHAQLLALGVAGGLGLQPMRLLDRRRAVADQTGLNAAERLKNLRGAFRARSCSGPLVLVDDLITTGATASACARALSAAGAESVELLAACRKS
jgi:predicted amidophosphoribosyltransferase